jgi:hypothetical protein
MRTPLVATVAAGAIAIGAHGFAQTAPPSPAATPPAAAPAAPKASKIPPQKTIVHGTVPDLTGKWLILFDLVLGEQRRTVAQLVEIGSKDGKVDVVEYFVNLPDPLPVQIEQEGNAGTYWQPTAEQLATIPTDWATLADANRGVTLVENEIWGQDGFDDTIKKEPDVKDARWVFRQTYAFEPGGQRPVKHVNVFGALTPDGTGWKGNAVAGSLAIAPFPVPITYKGTFRMIRLDAAPEPAGWLARILAMFKGCGR